MKKILSFIVFVIPFLSQAQNDQHIIYLENIRLEELKEHVKTLASEEFEGRGTGEKGLRLASNYIRNQFIQAGLKGASPTGDPYFQEFFLTKTTSHSVSIISGMDTMTSAERIFATGDNLPANLSTELCFLGYGIEADIYSDYSSDLNIRGKAVAFVAGEPKTRDGIHLITGSIFPSFTDRGASKAQLAYSKGAEVVLRIDPDQNRVLKSASMMARIDEGAPLSLPINDQEEESKEPGIIHIGINDAAKIFGVSDKKIQKSIRQMSKGKSKSGSFSANLQIKTDQPEKQVNTENIVALIEGTDLRDEWIIVTAHFDHLGVRNGNIYYGADDNATGTAALIEIAETFAEMADNGIRPRRSILFLPVTAEERGLLGSAYYAANPLFDLESTKAVVNMDMIGRSDNAHADNPDYVYLYVSDSSNSELANIARQASEQTKENLTPEYRFKEDRTLSTGGSDHASFERIGIPVMYFYCGTHPDYHRPGDTWEKIDYDKLTHISRLVFQATWLLANDIPD